MIRAALVLTVALAGCQKTADNGAAAPTGPADALAAFRSVCLATAPDFHGSTQAMRDAGLVRQTRTGAMSDANDHMSAKIQDRIGKGGVTLNRCSIVFDETDNDASLAALDTLLATRPGTGPARRGAIGQRTMTTWRIQADGRTGRVLFIPYQGPRLPAGYFLEFPERTGTA